MKQDASSVGPDHRFGSLNIAEVLDLPITDAVGGERLGAGRRNSGLSVGNPLGDLACVIFREGQFVLRCSDRSQSMLDFLRPVANLAPRRLALAFSYRQVALGSVQGGGKFSEPRLAVDFVVLAIG